MIANHLSLWPFSILLLGSAFSSELLLRLPLQKTIIYFKYYLKKSFRTIKSKHISDHWKEIAIPLYSIKLLQYSLYIILLTTISLTPIGLSLWVTTNSINEILVTSLDPITLAIITLTSLLYIFLRKKIT